MVTGSGRILARCAVVLLSAVLTGWLVLTGAGGQRADGAENAVRAAQDTDAPPPPPELTVTPDVGQPGDRVLVRGSGYDSCGVEFFHFEVFWDDQSEPLATADRSNGEFEVEVQIPPDAAIGEHRLVGWCGEENPEAFFRVPSSPVLTLVPTEGNPGGYFTATGSGYSQCNYDCPDGGQSPVDVYWDTGEHLGTASIGDQHTFSVDDIQVPQTAAPGDHQVYAESPWDEAEATFTVLSPPPPTLTLDPQQGRPGTSVHVEGSGYPGCSEGCPSVQVFWDGEQQIGTAQVSPEGTFTVDVVVPPAAAPGDHQIFGDVGEGSGAGASFTVLPPPTLTALPGRGQPGTLVHLIGSGYVQCTGVCPRALAVSPVEVLWDEGEVLATAALRDDGTFEADIQVPGTAAAGSHRITGRLGTDSAGTDFTVLPAAIDPAPLVLNLVPDEGKPGDSFQVQGRGYQRCPAGGERLVNIYDRNSPDGNGFSLALARNVPISPQGTFSKDVRMPPTAAPGQHEIVARCLIGGENTSKPFTVIGPSPGNPQPGDPRSGGPLPAPLPLPSGPGDLLPGPGQGGLVPGQQPGGSPSTGPTPPGGGSSPTPSSVHPEPPPDHSSGKLKRAFLAKKLISPFEVFDKSPLRLLLGVLLAVLLVALIAFPAEIFNRTVDKNREEIHGWFGWLRRLSLWNLPSWAQLAIFTVVGAALLMIVVQDAAFDTATLAQLFGYLIGVPLIAIVLEMSGDVYSWRRRGIPMVAPWHPDKWLVLPSTLLVAGVLAALSRLLALDPPYVYGLFAIYIGAERMLRNMSGRQREEEEGRRTFVGVCCVFALSVACWFAWVPLNRAFDRGLHGLGWLMLDALLSTVFFLGLGAAFFGMIPMAFLKGKEVYRWRREVWVVSFAVLAFVFVNLGFARLLNEEMTLGRVIKAVALFIAFGVFSVLFWAYFNPRLRDVVRRLFRVPHR